MSLFYENQGNNTYLVYQINPADELDTMSLGMMTNNHIPGFAAASFMQMDADKYLKFNVSSKVSVSQLFSGPVTKKRLISVFRGVASAMLSAEEYMLDTNSILLDLDYIFVDVSTNEVAVICLPVNNEKSTHLDVEMFFKNILFTTQFDQTENCDHVAVLINYLNANRSISLESFKDLLDRLISEKTQVDNRPKQPEPQVQQSPKMETQPAPVQGKTGNQFVPPVEKRQNVQYAQPVNNVPAKAPEQKEMPIPAVAATKTAEQKATQEKTGGWFSRRRNHNKENAAKSQKSDGNNNKKAQTKPAAAAKTSQPQMAIPGQQPQMAIAGQQPQMAIPGQQPQMAIPGQQSQMAIPGKQAQMPIPGQQPQKSQPVQQTQKPMAQNAPVAQQGAYQPASQPQTQNAMPLNFGETTVLGGGNIGETTVLGGGAPVQKQVEPYLIRAKNNEKIPLNKPVFRIGKERSYVDYFIGDNTAISRSHANIVNHNGEYFIVDTNSTNHTYVNGGMIASNVETKLAHGTKLRLANEDFEFKCY